MRSRNTLVPTLLYTYLLLLLSAMFHVSGEYQGRQRNQLLQNSAFCIPFCAIEDFSPKFCCFIYRFQCNISKCISRTFTEAWLIAVIRELFVPRRNLLLDENSQYKEINENLKKKKKAVLFATTNKLGHTTQSFVSHVVFSDGSC